MATQETIQRSNFAQRDRFKRVGQRDFVPSTVKKAARFLSEEVNTAIITPKNKPSEGTHTDIQEAIDHVNDLGGGVVLFRTGTFISEKDIILYSNIELVGSGNSISIIDFNGTNSRIIAAGISGNTLSNITIRDITIKSRRATANSTGAIDFNWVDRSTINNVNFTDNLPSGSETSIADMFINNADDLDVINNNSTSSHTLIHYESGTRGVISTNRVISCASFGIHLGSPARILVTSNIIRFPADTAINVGDVITIGTISNNIITEAAKSGMVVAFEDGSIVGNNIASTGASGSFDGINTSSGATLIINSNSLGNFDRDGIRIEAFVDDTVVVGNVSVANEGYGVNITASTCDNTIVVGNNCTGNTTGGINDSGTSSTIANNEV